MDTAREAAYSLCPDTTLDGSATCKRGGDVVSRHNCLRDLVLEFCRCAHQVMRVEKGSGLTPDHSRTRPADILVLDWDISLKQACRGGGGGGGGSSST